MLLIMTDEERYPPPYEQEAMAAFRKERLPARRRLREQGLELHQHQVASTACLPSRASLFTGQYPSLHGVTQTDGLTKGAYDPAMRWLDPDTVPTMGDWFRAAGYATHYRGKWHISHADLVVPGTTTAVAANDRDGNLIPAGADAYRRADRLDPFGFSGWIGPEPHGAAPQNTGYVRDPLYAEEVRTLFRSLADDAADDRPWLAVASFVNPHDIAFAGVGWQMLEFPPIPADVPEVPEAPSQADLLDERPSAQAEFRDLWPQVLYPQPADLAHRRFYHWLHELVDEAIERILEALDASGMAEDTIVVLTSDHGDLLGAHGGLVQKWHNAYAEAVHVPLVVSGPGIAAVPDGLRGPTSHVDLLPTLLGLVGADVEALTPAVREHHTEVQPLVGRDLSGVLRGERGPEALDEPVYFMTDDQITDGMFTTNRWTGEAFEPVGAPNRIETVVAALDTGAEGASELWKLNRYYTEVDADAAPAEGDRSEPIPDQWELHNLTIDPEERVDRAGRDAAVADRLRRVLDAQRAEKRRTPTDLVV